MLDLDHCHPLQRLKKRGRERYTHTHTHREREMGLLPPTNRQRATSPVMTQWCLPTEVTAAMVEFDSIGGPKNLQNLGREILYAQRLIHV
ncbi:hypothetical protein Hdeb2414_s0012g00386441 [Helianthus debilis subsp. tardiflorus]